MMKNYSVVDYVNSVGGRDVESFMYNASKSFEKLFGSVTNNIEIELVFECQRDAIDMYQEVKFNSRYRSLYTVRSSENGISLLVSGKDCLFDYIGSVEPNLLTLSRDLGISFKVNYRQEFSGTVFTGDVIGGELLSRQCIVSVSDVLPELSLGLLNKIGKDANELDLLLTRIIKVKAETILG